jgi:mercuric ion binding protein
MKKIIQKIGFLSATLAFATTAFAESVNVNVKGIVCAFCAQGVEKAFKSDKSVESVNVNLDEYRVELKFKTGQALSDEVITKRITDAGYNVVSIEREG